MQTLFESHPKLKNSLNTMPPAERNKVDFTDWEVDAEGFVSSVETVMPEYEFEDKLLWADSGKNSDVATSGMLPLEVQDWLNEHTNGRWFYDTRINMDKASATHRKILFTFHFEKVKDAMFFRLRWQK
jgi:hypothetical protein